MHPIKQNLYIRKLNGLGEKISVNNSLTIKQLKQIIKSLKSISESQAKQRDFNLIFKGKNITQKQNYNLKQLSIPSDGIIHLLFLAQSQQKIQNNNSNLFDQQSSLTKQNQQNSAKNIIQLEKNMNKSDKNINIHLNSSLTITIRVIFNQIQHIFQVNLLSSILDLKKSISLKLNLVYESLVLSHLGTEMLNERLIKDYYLSNNTLISVKFNLQRLQKKKLQTRLVNSVTFSDENNEPDKVIPSNSNISNLNDKFMISSSKSINSEKEEPPKSNTTNVSNRNMYKSEINAFSSSEASKAALMFKNALHQKIAETESIVSGSFSEDANNIDPNMVLITVRNQQQTKQFIFQCLKSHQIKDIKQHIFKVERIKGSEGLEISLEEDLFKSIDLNSSGCVTLNEIVKKMGKQRAILIYRSVK